MRIPGPRSIQVSVLMIGCAIIVAVNLYLIRNGASHGDASVAGPVASGAAPLAHPGEHAANPLADAAAPVPGSDAREHPPPDADGGPPPTPTTRRAGGRAPKPDKPGKRPRWHRRLGGGEVLLHRANRGPEPSNRRRGQVPRRERLRRGPRAGGTWRAAGAYFLYLDAPARDHLLRALDAHPNRVMKVHSALRTVAQQYLLSRWAANKRCGIQLATRPGESNHETGLALDIGEHGTWRSALESEGFRWLGATNRVHFDFVGPGAVHHDGLDVQAFQRLWNRNRPEDTISESGRYDGSTEQRVKKSPAGGFPLGARCERRREGRQASNGAATEGRALALPFSFFIGYAPVPYAASVTRVHLALSPTPALLKCCCLAALAPSRSRYPAR